MPTIPNDVKGLLFIVSTSHMDWDWNDTFEEYYETNSGSTPVKTILQNAFTLMADTSLSPAYQYNLAEVAWLQRYLKEFPSALAQIKTFKGQFFFLGGGLTSPDNLVCNGEAFIRNYMVGRAFIKHIGLENFLTDVCWIPDDFGQDPQLPVVLNAMGMKGVSFWRVPGNEPAQSNGTPPQPVYKPSDGSDGLSTLLENNGVTFLWKAADGSTSLTTLMWNNYGVIWDQSSTSGAQGNTPATLNSFVTAKVVQPGNLFLAPCGGDFSDPSSLLISTVNSYNSDYFSTGGSNYNGTGVKAVMGTYAEYIDAVNIWAERNPGGLITAGMDASNFWTGYFASRPSLKTMQQQAVGRLMAAEIISTLLHLQVAGTGKPLEKTDAVIAVAWENLCPSTHHDYVTGTSPDSTYTSEQRPLLVQALEQSTEALNNAMALLAAAMLPNSFYQGIPYVIFNPSGCTRTNSILVEIEATPALKNIKSVQLPHGEGYIRIQRTKSGKIVFPVYNMDSFGYLIVYLSEVDKGTSQPAGACRQDSYTFDNGLVEVTVTQESGWAISSLLDMANGNKEMLTAGGYGNRLTLYYETKLNVKSTPYGNLYQMGDEMVPTATNGDGFYADRGTGTNPGTSYYTALVNSNPPGGACTEADVKYGALIENGPWLWHFSGQVENASNKTTATVEYKLYAGDPMVRVKVTGNASSGCANSVTAAWQVAGGSSSKPMIMSYGTANHWNAPDLPTEQGEYGYKPYWNGPDFRPVHDYLTLDDPMQQHPAAAVYTQAMRAWAYYDDNTLNQWLLIGTLFRNATGHQRGANGSDTDTHIQEYAFGVPGSAGIGIPETCRPLQAAVNFQMPLQIAPVAPLTGITQVLEERGSLATLQSDNGILRVARPQQRSNPFSFALRIYQPTNDTTKNWQVMVPYFYSPFVAPPQVSRITALENPLPDVPQPTYGNGLITIPQMPTLATIQVQKAE